MRWLAALDLHGLWARKPKSRVELRHRRKEIETENFISLAFGAQSRQKNPKLPNDI